MDLRLDKGVTPDEKHLEETLKGKSRMQKDEILGEEELRCGGFRKRCCFLCQGIRDSGS